VQMFQRIFFSLQLVVRPRFRINLCGFAPTGTASAFGCDHPKCCMEAQR
jgi:hypothetical protein